MVLGQIALRRAFLLVIGAAAAAACSGETSSSGNPNSPSGSGSGSTGTCRTFPTAATVTTTSAGQTITAQLTGAFDTSTNRSTVTSVLPNGATCTSSVSSYRSKDDFVDEVRVIPGLFMQTSTTTTNTACGTGTFTTNYNYDSQRRLTSTTTTVFGVSTATTYTAWDSSGRPTLGSFPGTTITNAYNDATRTWVQTQTAGGVTSTTTMTFDANGNQVTVVNTSGNFTSTAAYNTTTTTRVCK